MDADARKDLTPIKLRKKAAQFALKTVNEQRKSFKVSAAEYEMSVGLADDKKFWQRTQSVDTNIVAASSGTWFKYYQASLDFLLIDCCNCQMYTLHILSLRQG